MQSVNIDDTPFNGRSRSVTSWDGPRRWPECRSCGSSLAGRFEGSRTSGARVTLTWRCRCGRRRQIRQEVGA